MEDFFIKLGFMTQKNNAELIQEIRALRTSIDALAAEISALNRTSTANHADVAKKITALAESSTANHNDVAEKISALAETSTNMQELLRLTVANQIMNLVKK